MLYKADSHTVVGGAHILTHLISSATRMTRRSIKSTTGDLPWGLISQYKVKKIKEFDRQCPCTEPEVSSDGFCSRQQSDTALLMEPEPQHLTRGEKTVVL